MNKKILCIFTDNEGSSALDDYLHKHNDIYRPGYELLDAVHQADIKTFKKYEKEYFLSLYGIYKGIQTFKLKTAKHCSKEFIYNQQEYLSIIEKYKYIYFKYRMPIDLYYLIDYAKIDYIILPIRYDFERIIGKYLKQFQRENYDKYSHFNKKRENKFKSNKNLLNVNINHFKKSFDLQIKYLKEFKIKLLKLREFNSTILIFDYCKFSKIIIIILKIYVRY